ncbi:hypothetical protein D515_04814 [Grimontia indica]|uniref:Uncharacterized protein n=1 Tax=Grimontia indica TaxID=1056512 RepID=R1IZM2_9GAMM|nr:hypothetical protein [Grimontia indica]EOD80835.1 hypothetical protein D515_04814 [Grimontia indica]
MSQTEPMIKFDDGGNASLLRYDLPASTAFTYEQVSELVIPSKFKRKKSTDSTSNQEKSAKNVVPMTMMAMKAHAISPLWHAVLANETDEKINEQLIQPAPVNDVIEDTPIQNEAIVQTAVQPLDYVINKYGMAQVQNMLENGYVIDSYVGISGIPNYDLYLPNLTSVPTIRLVEKITVRNYLGDYGAGRVVDSFSLLPGEEVELSIRSFEQTKTNRSETQSILDAHSSDTQSELTESLDRESKTEFSEDTQDKWRLEGRTDYRMKTSAKVDIPVVGSGGGENELKISVSGGYETQTNTHRANTQKTAESALKKHIDKVNAKREVNVQVDRSSSHTEENEFSEKRTIRNINVSRTLNFVARQMNQEYLSTFALTGAYLEVDYGTPASIKRYELYELDALFEDCIADRDYREDVTKVLYRMLASIRDHQGNTRSLIKQEHIKTPEKKALLSVDHQVTTPVSEIGGKPIDVPGIVLAVNQNILQTSGVVVEALLGQSNALDPYSMGLQANEVRRRELENSGRKLKTHVINALIDIANQPEHKENAIAAISALQTIHNDCCEEEKGDSA